MRVCSGAFRTTPVSALRRTKLALHYWVNVKANKPDLPTKCLKEKDCEQAGKTKQFSFGNSTAKQAGEVAILEKEVGPTICWPSTLIYTDGSGDPSTGRTTFTVYMWEQEKGNRRRLPNQKSVYTAELLAILCALRWIKDCSPQ